MVTVKQVVTRTTEKGVESNAVITAADGDKVTAADLGLHHINIVTAVTPATAGHVAGAAVVTNPGSAGNDVTLTLYSLTANSDSLVAAGSVDWVITAIQL